MLEGLKNILDSAYHAVAIAAAIAAIWVYYRNRKLEQSKWASNLYEKFYEAGHYKKVRDILDSDDCDEISILVRKEGAEFTDYLNFFEQIAIFTASKQLDKKDGRGPVLLLFRLPRSEACSRLH